MEGDHVNKGDILFVLDKKALLASLAKAEAGERSAQADLIMAEAEYLKAWKGPRIEEVRAAEASEQKATMSLNFAQDNLRRIERLHNEKAISDSELDKAQNAYKEALKVHEEAFNHLLILRQGSRREELDAAKANVDTKKAKLEGAKADLRQAVVNLEFADISAPFEGIIVRKWENSGAVVQAGKPVLTLFNPRTLHVAANIEEKKLYRVNVGDAVDISVDAYPDLTLSGEVEKILPVTNSEFSLIPAEGVSGTYIKVSQRVPIRIAVNCPPDLNLGPGLSVEISIHASGSKRVAHE